MNICLSFTPFDTTTRGLPILTSKSHLKLRLRRRRNGCSEARVEVRVKEAVRGKPLVGARSWLAAGVF
ncbi:hypothetical protein PVK06_039479 [Gossypium arboreum]|uniref:Uncharacterized protein n=1 Tax=Gossypium arboreum TaxID=29729 RepID=A0ABR0N2Z3_GOSAR|nr:hypothetical protein PVK06_039479 [Gossypium arboreum]